MAMQIFITGSSDGLGKAAANHLIKAGHRVTIHARNEQRAQEAQSAVPGAEGCLVGDLSSLSQTKQLAEKANATTTFDCVIHNCGIYQGPFRPTDKGYPSLLVVNVLAPYMLTCLMHKPRHSLVYLSSDSHFSGDGSLKDLLWQERGQAKWSDHRAYGDSKLCNNLLANAFARRWPDIRSNSFHPGWVATKMGGSMAPGSLNAGMEAYQVLAEGKGKGDCSGKFFYPGAKETQPQAAAESEETQEKLIDICKEATGVSPPS